MIPRCRVCGRRIGRSLSSLVSADGMRVWCTVTCWGTDPDEHRPDDVERRER